jgi:hypothetical protein
MDVQTFVTAALITSAILLFSRKSGVMYTTAVQHAVSTIPIDPIHEGVITTDIGVIYNVKTNKEIAIQTAHMTL